MLRAVVQVPAVRPSTTQSSTGASCQVIKGGFSVSACRAILRPKVAVGCTRELLTSQPVAPFQLRFSIMRSMPT